MSQTPDAPVVNILNLEESTEEAAEKQSFVQKGVNFVKSHKKSTIAVGALVGLVGVAALTGRQESDSPASTEPSEEAMEQARLALEEMNIPVSQEN